MSSQSLASIYQTAVRRVPYVLTALGLLAVVGLISVAVVTRNAGIRIGGLQTIAQLIGVWLAFLLCGALAYERRHIRIDFFIDRLPERPRRYHRILVLVLNIGFCAVLIVGSVLAIRQFADSTAPNVAIPIPLYYLAPLVGIGLLASVYVLELLERLGVASTPNGRGDE